MLLHCWHLWLCFVCRTGCDVTDQCSGLFSRTLWDCFLVPNVMSEKYCRGTFIWPGSGCDIREKGPFHVYLGIVFSYRMWCQRNRGPLKLRSCFFSLHSGCDVRPFNTHAHFLLCLDLLWQSSKLGLACLRKIRDVKYPSLVCWFLGETSPDVTVDSID